MCVIGLTTSCKFVPVSLKNIYWWNESLLLPDVNIPLLNLLISNSNAWMIFIALKNVLKETDLKKMHKVILKLRVSASKMHAFDRTEKPFAWNLEMCIYTLFMLNSQHLFVLSCWVPNEVAMKISFSNNDKLLSTNFRYGENMSILMTNYSQPNLDMEKM